MKIRTLRLYFKIHFSGYFDRKYYRERYPDVAESGMDPLLHYILFGWKEGRDPSVKFDTKHYLISYPDVQAAGTNPLLHYLAFGKKEGRLPLPKVLTKPLKEEPTGESNGVGIRFTPDDPMTRPGNTDFQQAMKQMAARDKNGTKQPYVDTFIGSDTLIEYFMATINRGQKFVISLSHDNYLTNVGGLQIRIRDEMQKFNTQQISYLHIFPYKPSPLLIDDLNPFYMGLSWNGKVLGVTTDEEFFRAMERINPSMLVRVIVHHFMGYNARFIRKLLTDYGRKTATFYLHDFYSICPSYYLLRNDIANCHAPKVDSNACMICRYGVERKRQQRIFQALFKGNRFEVIASSDSTLHLWQRSFLPKDFPGKVIPFASLYWLARRPIQKKARALQIAFVGYPLYHKGWPAWVALTKRLSDRTDLEFYHFSKYVVDSPFFRNVPVTVSKNNRLAMVDSLCRKNVDAVVLWSICQETFSFTLYESLAAGCFIITNPDSGNIADFINRDPSRGVVLEDEEALAGFVGGHEIVERLQQYQAGGRPQAELVINL